MAVPLSGLRAQEHIWLELPTSSQRIQPLQESLRDGCSDLQVICHPSTHPPPHSGRMETKGNKGKCSSCEDPPPLQPSSPPPRHPAACSPLHTALSQGLASPFSVSAPSFCFCYFVSVSLFCFYFSHNAKIQKASFIVLKIQPFKALYNTLKCSILPFWVINCILM